MSAAGDARASEGRDIFRATLHNTLNKGQKQVYYDLVDRKLSGRNRSEARRFIYLTDYREKLDNFAKRLESLPDLPAAASSEE